MHATSSSLKFICIVHVFVWILVVESTAPTGCFAGLCAMLRRKPRKVHPMDTGQRQIGFDDCLHYDHYSTLETTNLSANTTNPPETQMISEIQQWDAESMIALLPEKTITRNVQWFGVDPNFIQNDTVITLNINIIIADITMYDITHHLYWLAHYLPLKNASNKYQFQRVFDYFAQCQDGATKVNFKRWIQNFETMSQKVLNLLQILTGTDESTVNIPGHVMEALDPSQRKSLQSISQRMKKPPTLSSVSSANLPKKSYFWNRNWLHWRQEPLQFAGLDCKERETQIEAMLVTTAVDMNRLMKQIIGYNDHPVGINSVRDVMKLRKACDVFVRSYFKDSINFGFVVTPTALTKLLRFASNEQKKMLFGLRQVFVLDTLKFLLTFETKSRPNAQQKPPKLKVRMKPRWISSSEHIFVFEMQFDSKMIIRSRFGKWKYTMAVINEYMMQLLRKKDSVKSLGFKNIQDKGGVLFLLNIVLQFSIVGGRCGYGYNEKNKEFEASIVCELPFGNLNKERNNVLMEKHFRFSRRFVEKRNGTEDYDWTILEDLTGLNFKDIEYESSDSFDEDYEMDIAPKRRGKGLTKEDLQRHNVMMQQYNDH